jgi:hypothetical protein
MAALLLVLVCGRAETDEGMYTFDNPPLEAWKTDYGFEPGGGWIEHIMQSAVRFNNGGSGAFVSAHGLVVTNHHVGFDCIQKLSTAEKDFVEEGFTALKLEDEAPCPDLELNVLVSLEDVTQRVTAAAKGAADDAEAGKLRRMETAKIEKECQDDTGLRCDVTALYGGGQYTLHRYRRHTEVRLVMAPEQQAAFFGGNFDNFTYPRYDLDFSLFRVYEDGKPYQPPHFLKWSKTGPAEGDLVFVIGNPGSTGRLLTVSQLEFLRDVKYPNRLRTFKRIKDVLEAYADQSDEHARQVKKDLFSYDNALKAYRGLLEGVTGQGLLEKKKKEEAEFKKALKKHPGIFEKTRDSWDRIAAAQEAHADIHVARYLVSALVGRSEILRRAVAIVQLVAEKKKPNEERLEEYRDSALPSLELDLFSDAPIYRELEKTMIENSLNEILDVLGKDHAVAKAALGDDTPAGIAAGVSEQTALGDVKKRRKLVDKGANLGQKQWEKSAVVSMDPAMQLALRLDPIVRELKRRYEDEVESVERSEGLLLAEARFEVFGKNIPPDATFTPRIAYGTVKGYEAEGTLVSHKTTFYGLFARSAAFGGAAPFHLPPRWLKKKKNLDMAAALNFCYTADTIGGNSGSPVINRKGELMGLNFDRNFSGLGSRYYYYEEEKARAVAVHSAGILEALAGIFEAPSIVQELLSGKMPSPDQP